MGLPFLPKKREGTNRADKNRACMQVKTEMNLPDPVVLEKEEQMLEREQNERDVLDVMTG